MKNTTRTGIIGAGMITAAVVAGGCGKAAVAPTAPTQQVVAAGCGRAHPGVGAVRAEDVREGSTVALAKLGDRTIAYVADEDDAVVHTVDVSSGRELGTTNLAGVPAQLLVAKDGRVLVALRDKNQVQVLEPAAQPEQSLENRCSIDVATEPVALASTPDDATVLVSSAWGRTLTALDGSTMQTKFRVPLAREPHSIVVSDDGSKVFVSHVVGSRVSQIDLASNEHPVRTVDMSGSDPSSAQRRGAKRSIAGLLKGGGKGPDRMGCQSFALAKSIDPPGRVFAPQVLVDPGDGEQNPGGYGDGNRPAEVASIGIIDENNGEPLDASLRVSNADFQMQQFRSNGDQKGTECLLPRAAVSDGSRRSLFVTCLGVDSLVEYDATSANPHAAEKRRWNVGAGPTGVAIDHSGDHAVVWSQFDQSLAIVNLKDDKSDRPAVLALSRKAKAEQDGDVALGRKLFHDVGDPRISSDGRACASCHPDGRDDSLTWATPDGPRNTPMLAGRLAMTAPYGWNGESDEVKVHLSHTFQRLQGRGLDQHEVDALVAYVTTMRTPQWKTPENGPDATRVARGKEIFDSKEAECSSCHHEDGSFVDGAAHDVESKATADRQPGFDTPSLRFVGGTAPYFHDGRYRTLRDMLLGHDGKMGHTKQLSQADLDALEAYLRTL